MDMGACAIGNTVHCLVAISFVPHGSSAACGCVTPAVDNPRVRNTCLQAKDLDALIAKEGVKALGQLSGVPIAVKVRSLTS